MTPGLGWVLISSVVVAISCFVCGCESSLDTAERKSEALSRQEQENELKQIEKETARVNESLQRLKQIGYAIGTCERSAAMRLALSSQESADVVATAVLSECDYLTEKEGEAYSLGSPTGNVEAFEAEMKAHQRESVTALIVELRAAKPPRHIFKGSNLQGEAI